MIMLIVSKVLAVFVMIIVLICNRSQAQRYSLPNVPCPNIFQYEYDGIGYVGIITLRGVSYGTTSVEIEMTQYGPSHSGSGELSLNIDKDSVFDYIRMGRPVTFRVDFPNQNIIPQVTAIRANGMLICSGPKGPLPRTTFTMQYEMTVHPGSGAGSLQSMPANINFGMNYNDPMSRLQQDPAYMHHNDFVRRHEEFLRRVNQYRPGNFNYPGQDGAFRSPVSPYIPPFNNNPGAIDVTNRFAFPTNPSSLAYINSICGRQINNVVSELIVNGQDLTIPTFPWIVAIYKKKVDLMKFNCGGNLISSRSVISAAHCFKEGTDTVPADRFLFSLGRFKLSEWENAVNVGVENILIHPDYKKLSHSLDADIAIVQLRDSVSFKDTILPICLWHGPIEDSPHNGLIVGWGEDERHTTHTDIPKFVTANIVSESTCVRKKPELVYITSNRTLCAGDLNGSGPCKGDSGNGLMTKVNGKWLLRGIVSSALANDSTDCDLHEYVIFSDIAKFTDWIRTNML